MHTRFANRLLQVGVALGPQRRKLLQQIEKFRLSGVPVAMLGISAPNAATDSPAISHIAALSAAEAKVQHSTAQDMAWRHSMLTWHAGIAS